jgi:hypothetical protein
MVKTAAIIIDIDDKSLIELNEEIKELEQSIQNLKIGTKEWIAQNQRLGELKTKFSQATSEAKKLQNSVEKIGSAEQARAIAKLGAGMVGAFAGISGAITLMGGSSEAFDKITAKAATFLSVMQGLRAISTAFSAGNLAALKSIGAGFKTLVTTVRAASLGIKAALISTGIGALIVGVGLLIANFDKIKNLFGGQKAIKAAEEEVKLNEAILKQFEARANAEKQIMDFVQKQNEYQKDAFKLARQNLEFAQVESDIAYSKIQALKAENEQIDIKLKRSTGLSQEKRNELSRQKDVNIELLRGLEFERQRLLLLRIEAVWYVEIADDMEKLNKSIKIHHDNLIRISAEANNQRNTYLENLHIYEEQIQQLDLQLQHESLITDELVEQRKTLLAQVEALNAQEKERLRIRDLAIHDLAHQRINEEQLQKIIDKYTEIRLNLNKEYDQLKANADLQELNIELIDSEFKLYESIIKQREEVENFDRKGHIAFNERTKELAYELNLYTQQAEEEYNKITAGIKIREFNKNAITDAAIQLSFFKLQKEEMIRKIELEIQSNENRIKLLETQKDELKNNDLINQANLKYQQSLLDAANIRLGEQTTLEGELAVGGEIFAIEKNINEILNQQSQAKSQIVDIDGEILGLNTDIEVKTQDILNNAAAITTEEEKVTAEMEKQARWSETANDWLKRYAKEIEVTQQLISKSIEFIAALQDRKADKAQERINKYQKQLDKLNEEEAERQSGLKDYENELMDANGDRYNELLRKIEEEKIANISAKTEIEAKQKQIDDENIKRQKAEYKAAKWRKAQAIVDAVIQGALAVIKALPNIFLSIATGVLAGVGIATISAQHIPPEDQMAKGGFTKKGKSNEPAGIVHKNEYVVPAFVTESIEGQAHIAALERQRMRGYESGGLVQPTVNTGGGDYIDYERLGAVILNGIMKLPSPIVSVQQITSAQNEVAVTKKLAGL